MFDAMTTAERSAIDRSPTFMAALDLKLAQAGHPLLKRDQIEVEKLGSSSQLRFRIDGVDRWTPELTKAVRAATVAVAGLEAQFGHMDRDNAVGGVKDPGLDMKRFLEVRETAECREFREFVSRSASMSDEELRARTTSIRARTGAGLVLGPAASAADTFLVEKVFPSTGIISFIGSQYPSIFR